MMAIKDYGPSALKMVVILAVIFILVQHRGHVSATKGTFEKKLRDQLLDENRYDKTVRPTIDHNQAINVSFGMRLSKLVELNTKKQLLIVDVWIVQRWMNPFLSWNQSQYGNVHTLHVKPQDLWVPDTVLYDNGDEDVSQAGFLEKFKTYVTLDSSGLCSWMAPATFKSSCNMDITDFPFDSQTCQMTFGSWTYDSRLLQMLQLDTTHARTEKFVTNGDWKLQNVTIERRLMTYSCCKHPFSDITYTFFLDRKPHYHILYLVLPCVIILFLSLVGFFLPPDCGERVGLSMSFLLTMSVYLLIVSDILPETSDYVPRLGMYYMCVMGELALVLTATAISLRCHFSRGKPPKYLLRLIGHKVTPKPSPSAIMTLVNEISLNRSVKIENNQPKDDVNDKEWKECWMDIAQRLDKIFVVIFTVLFIATSLAILVTRKSVSNA